MDFRSGVEALVVTGGGSVRVGSSSNCGGGGGDDDLSVSPPRDPEKGKCPAVEEMRREVPVEPAEFIPPVGTSRHDPISKSDLAEFVGEDVLA